MFENEKTDHDKNNNVVAGVISFLVVVATIVATEIVVEQVRKKEAGTCQKA